MSDEKKPVWTKSQAMKQLMENEERHDIWFIVEGERIGANKVVMVTSSPYFEKLLEEAFEKEWSEKEFEMDVVTAKTFKLVLEYCYLGEVNLNKMPDIDLKNLYEAAQQYQLDLLNQTILAHVSKELNQSNWLFWVQAVLQRDEEDLKKAIFGMINRWHSLSSYSKTSFFYKCFQLNFHLQAQNIVVRAEMVIQCIDEFDNQHR